MKIITLHIIIIFSTVFSLTSLAQGFASGTGTAVDPYIINSVAHLKSMHTADYTNPLYFELTSDIDLEGINWIPVNSIDPFSKHIHFDGNYHVIKNMKVVRQTYGSLFGVLCGSCKNLGVINADVESSNGGGIIAGYAGLKGPSKPTGMIINCYTTGKVKGTDGVGGIVGNIGKPNGDDLSGVKNCYSTADVTATNTSGYSRAGGIVGIVFEKGILENCYATGTVKSSRFGAGGITGWSDMTMKGLVALNDTIINKVTGNIGRVAAYMGSVGGIQTQGINCWGNEKAVLKNADYILTENDLHQEEVTVINAPYDGVSKTSIFLGDPTNYFLELEWDFAGDYNIWAQTMSNGMPIFQWLFNRSDYAMIDGHTLTTSVNNQRLKSINMTIHDGSLEISSGNQINEILIFNITGQLVYTSRAMNTNVASAKLDQSGIFIVSVLTDGKWNSLKLINK